MNEINKIFIKELINLPDLTSRKGKWAVPIKTGSLRDQKNIGILWIDSSSPIKEGYTVSLQKVSSKIHQAIIEYEHLSKENRDALSKEEILILNKKIRSLNDKIKKRNASILRKILHVLTLGFGFKELDEVKPLSNLKTFLQKIDTLNSTKSLQKTFENFVVQVKIKGEPETSLKKLLIIDEENETLTFIPADLLEYEIHDEETYPFKTIESIETYTPTKEDVAS